MKPKNREDYRNDLAVAFSSVLEEKGVQWHQEWLSTHAGFHKNAVTGSLYRGCNAFSLALVAMEKGYTDPRWVTMNQIQDTKGTYHPKEKWHLKKGSKATWVEYWMPYDIKEKKAISWETYKQEIARGAQTEAYSLVPRYTAVFNAAEVEGMPEQESVLHPEIRQDALIRDLSAAMHLDLMLDGGSHAYYSVMEDTIHLPQPDLFETEYAFNATALHEISHATGHPSRLNRIETMVPSPEHYAYEELVAEICSCFMGFDLVSVMKENQLENHKAYVRGWAQSIREKPDLLIHAIRDAQNAATYLDYMAGNIPEAEYEKRMHSVFELKRKEKVPER